MPTNPNPKKQAKPKQKRLKRTKPPAESLNAVADAAKEGRPTDYTPAHCEVAKRLCMLRFTDKELAEFFGIAESTLNLWKEQHPEFMESVRAGKEPVDADVVVGMYESAKGANWVEQQAIKVKRTQYADGKKVSEEEEVVIVDLKKQAPPNPVSGKFWLTNRQRKHWQEKIVHAVGGDKDGVPIRTREMSKVEAARRVAFMLANAVKSAHPQQEQGSEENNDANAAEHANHG